MKISFVIPAYNEEAHLSGCIKAIQREIEVVRSRGSGSNIEAEIIVVNNASTDRTKEVAQSFAGVRVVDEPHKGLVRARQAGFVVSTGDLIANIDSDVMLTEGWVDTVLEAFRKDTNLVCLSGPFIMHDVSPFVRVLVSVWYGISYVLHAMAHLLGVGAVAQGGNYVVRRSALEKIGGFDTTIEFYGEDTDIARRMAKVGRVVWTSRLPVYSSGRRLRHEGVLQTAFRYGINFFWVTLFGKPFTHHHKDIRSE
jgi:glycosyltransferase involved in cell wall biosynthesis